MNTELPSIAQRAARHAALGDHARLRIVDLLAARGDHTPTELGTELGMRSNLLAHHLGILERAGILGRVRSEGDRRRTYLRLVPLTVEQLSAQATIVAERIIFICTANSARSPLAAALWRLHHTTPASSAGIHPGKAVAPLAVAAARQRGIDISTHLPRALPSPDRLKEVLLVTLCDRAYEQLQHPNTIHWSIPNPSTRGTKDAYAATIDELELRIPSLVDQFTRTSPRM